LVIAALSYVALDKKFLFDLNKEVYAREMRIDLDLRAAATKLLTVLKDERGWKQLYEETIARQKDAGAEVKCVGHRQSKGDAGEKKFALIRGLVTTAHFQ